MSLEHSPSRAALSAKASPASIEADPDYWFSLINEEPAAEFVGLKVRTMQGYRYRGGGPKFIRISARCVKYRRIDLRRWAEAHLRSSTSDTGPAA